MTWTRIRRFVRTARAALIELRYVAVALLLDPVTHFVALAFLLAWAIS